MQSLGQHLAELRKKHKLKQIELAEKLHVSQQVISNIERDQSAPDLDFLRGAADVYNISLDQLVGREFLNDVADETEKKIISCIKQMDDEGKKLSLGILNQVIQHRGNNDGDK